MHSYSCKQEINKKGENKHKKNYEKVQKCIEMYRKIILTCL